MGFGIDTNNYCLTNPLAGRDVEDRVGHCHLRVIPRPRRSLVHFNVSRYSSRYLQKKRKIGEGVGVWYIPTRNVKLEL